MKCQTLNLALLVYTKMHTICVCNNIVKNYYFDPQKYRCPDFYFLFEKPAVEINSVRLLVYVYVLYSKLFSKGRFIVLVFTTTTRFHCIHHACMNFS